MSPWLYPFYICRHPRDGFLELKANKKASTPVVTVILIAWLFAEVLYRMAADFDMNNFSPDDVSLLRVSLTTIIIYAMVCLANWCICTLMDGKGNMKEICVVAAFAMVPYIIARLLATGLSWIFAGDEAVFIEYGVTITKIWGALIAFSGLQEIHEYSFVKTLYSILLTIVGLIIMFFLALMLLILFQQLYYFIVTIGFEIRY